MRLGFGIKIRRLEFGIENLGLRLGIGLGLSLEIEIGIRIVDWALGLVLGIKIG